jgi:hypothetical protein
MLRQRVSKQEQWINSIRMKFFRAYTFDCKVFAAIKRACQLKYRQSQLMRTALKVQGCEKVSKGFLEKSE